MCNHTHCFSLLQTSHHVHLRHSCTLNRKASFKNWKVSSEEVEGFFQRAPGSYTYKFPKMRWSFTYRSSRAVFVSSGASFLKAKWHSNGVMSTNARGYFFLLTVTLSTREDRNKLPKSQISSPFFFFLIQTLD